jgi:excisionase family DNA binding protein
MARREMISTAEAARRLGFSTITIRNYVASGHLTAYRIGVKLLKFDVAEVDSLREPIDETSR